MKKSQVFNPDVRNLGGRKLLVNHMYNHRSSLDNIKPKVGSLDMPASMAKKAKQGVSFKQIEDYQNLMIMKMKISKVKKSIDNNKPVSFDLIRQGQPGGATSKQYQFINEEHFRNLLSQKRQIESFGTMNDRRKNINDFIAYPPRFFRRLDNGQMNLYNSLMQQQRSFQNSTLQLQQRPKTAQVRLNDQGNDDNDNRFQHNQNIYIQDPNGQFIQQEYGIDLTPEQYQLLLQQQILQNNNQQQSINNQLLLHQQLQLSNDPNEQLQNQQLDQENQYQEFAKQNLQIFNGQNNENNSMSSVGNTLVSPSATTATAGLSSQLKVSPIKNEGYLNNQHQYNSPNNIQSSPQSNALLNSIQNNYNIKSANKINSLLGKQNKIKSAGPNNQQNNSNNRSNPQSDISKKTNGSGNSKKTSQKLLTVDQENTDKSKLSEEQKWITIIEEIPVLLDANEESLKALKMHLINIIIDFRLYRITDYENMKEIFIQKNKDISIELGNEIFSEIIDALNE